jgi:hypothetical protein
VLASAEELLSPEVALELDYYWHGHSRTRSTSVGQPSDDLHELLEDDHARVPQEVWHDLSHINGVLRALGAVSKIVTTAHRQIRM